MLLSGFPGVTIHDPDRYALEVLTTVLGGQGGRLFVELRDPEAILLVRAFDRQFQVAVVDEAAPQSAGITCCRQKQAS